MKHIRAGTLALRLLGIILVVFSGIDIIRCVLGMIVDNGGIAYISSLLHNGLVLLVGIVMIVVAGIIRKKYIK